VWWATLLNYCADMVVFAGDGHNIDCQHVNRLRAALPAMRSRWSMWSGAQALDFFPPLVVVWVVLAVLGVVRVDVIQHELVNDSADAKAFLLTRCTQYAHSWDGMVQGFELQAFPPRDGREGARVDKFQQRHI
jgi:hypothetical protein